MKLTLHPDPGNGRHWRLTLEVAGVELYSDVASRSEPEAALHAARGVADALGLVAAEPDEWTPAPEGA